jgi:hypothetical protein
MGKEKKEDQELSEIVAFECSHILGIRKDDDGIECLTEGCEVLMPRGQYYMRSDYVTIAAYDPNSHSYRSKGYGLWQRKEVE